MIKTGKFIPLGIALLSLCSFLTALYLVDWSPANLFLTPDQRGRILMARQEYAKAARVFDEPLQRGTAQYRTGDFKNAAASFGQADSVEALYNRSNAMVMLGNYDQAIAGYHEVLNKKPDWQEAADNLELAEKRKKRLNPPDEGDTGTGGYLPPDKVVFDKRAAKASGDQKETVSGGKKRLTEWEVQAMWLRKVQTQPTDFLRAKFSYQAAVQDTKNQGQEEKK